MGAGVPAVREHQTEGVGVPAVRGHQMEVGAGAVLALQMREVAGFGHQRMTVLSNKRAGSRMAKGVEKGLMMLEEEGEALGVLH